MAGTIWFLVFGIVEELKCAVFEWQDRHEVDSCLTTGFLDGNHPIVDAYELKLRLEHVLRRLRTLEESAHTAPPMKIFDYLYLGNAVTSQSCYTLKHLGITHIINATTVSKIRIGTSMWSLQEGVSQENFLIYLVIVWEQVRSHDYSAPMMDFVDRWAGFSQQIHSYRKRKWVSTQFQMLATCRMYSCQKNIGDLIVSVLQSVILKTMTLVATSMMHMLLLSLQRKREKFLYTAMKADHDQWHW